MATTALQQITTKAKALQRADKKLSWKDAIKKASAIYRGKHSLPKKSVTRSKAVKKSVRKTVRKKARNVGKVKKPMAGRHTDTRSHNVNIRVISGLPGDHITADNFARIKTDSNGNPRYVLHWINLANNYKDALAIAKKAYGKKYDNKSYRGGIVFQTYNVNETAAALNKLVRESRQVGSTLLLEKGESPRKKPNRILQIRRTKAGTFRKFSSVGALPAYKHPIAVRDILLTGENNAQLYRSKRLPILKNLTAKYKKGTFKTEQAAKLWLYYVNEADKAYNREYVNKNAPGYLLDISDRRLAALELAKETAQELESGASLF